MATEIFFTLSIVLTGSWVWLGARDGVHIGASGLIYALAAFLMLSGFLRRDNRLMALSFVVVFLYGSLIWGGYFQNYFLRKKHFLGRTPERFIGRHNFSLVLS